MDTNRFRSIDNLLGEHRELELQSIYLGTINLTRQGWARSS